MIDGERSIRAKACLKGRVGLQSCLETMRHRTGPGTSDNQEERLGSFVFRLQRIGADIMRGTSSQDELQESAHVLPIVRSNQKRQMKCCVLETYSEAGLSLSRLPQRSRMARPSYQDRSWQ